MSGFAASSILMGICSFAAIPIVISTVGLAGWSAIAVGQNVGMILTLIVMFGLSQAGPEMVSNGPDYVRGSTYVVLLKIRIAIFVALVPATLFVTWVLATPNFAAAALAALSQMMVGVGASWFFVGERNPSGLLYFDTAPRAVGLMLGSFSSMVFPNAVVVGAGMVFGAVLATGLSSIVIIRRYPVLSKDRKVTRRDLAMMWSHHRFGFHTSLLSSISLYLPLLAIQWFAPSAAPSFALVDRLRQQFLVAIKPVIQFLQGWVPRHDAGETRERSLVAFKFGMVFSALSFVAYVGVVLLFIRFFSDEESAVGVWLVVLMAASVALNVANVSVSLGCFAPLRLNREIAVSAGIGALVTIVALVPAAIFSGALGVAALGALSQLLTFCYLLVVFRIDSIVYQQKAHS
ncbi:hypothetical protein [Gordonia alkanivorans]|uniref:hypothetical protein n=1 Tax=Gordonia alkanivorans TaxID=84096 RepID=UPI0024469F6C|nr:hypothetical protein [Gordonia alkanivorans]MDH3012550.1 hypothetical protein [Gordonia alkanivorans]